MVCRSWEVVNIGSCHQDQVEREGPRPQREKEESWICKWGTGVEDRERQLFARKEDWRGCGEMKNKRSRRENLQLKNCLEERVRFFAEKRVEGEERHETEPRSPCYRDRYGYREGSEDVTARRNWEKEQDSYGRMPRRRQSQRETYQRRKKAPQSQGEETESRQNREPVWPEVTEIERKLQTSSALRCLY